MSVVIDQVIAASEADDGPYAGLVDGGAIAVAGHSNGGITTMGTTANSCCRDDGANFTVPTLPRPESSRVATADVTTDLVNGSTRRRSRSRRPAVLGSAGREAGCCATAGGHTADGARPRVRCCAGRLGGLARPIASVSAM